MKHTAFGKSPRLRRAVVIGSIAVLAFGPGAGAAAADTAVLAPPVPAGLDFGAELDPQLVAELTEIEERVLQEEQQGQQLRQQEQGIETKIQANEQEAASVQQKVSDWNAKTAALNDQFQALQVRIDAHNAEPNTFEIPDQEAAADAYQAEADELRTEQSQLQAQQNELDQEKAAISAEQDQVDTEGQQLDSQNQQLNSQITDFNNGAGALESQAQQLLQQVVSALQAAAVAQQVGGTQSEPVAGGDQGRPAAASADDGQAGDDGGDPGSPKATNDALSQYGGKNGVLVYEHPLRVLLTPGTVTRLSPATAAGLSPYHTYDGMVRNQDGTYTALEVVSPGAKPDPFDQAINQGGQATVEVGGKSVTITRVQTVPSGRPSVQAPTVPALDPATLALLRDNGQAELPGPRTAPGQDDDPLPYGAEMLRPLPWENRPDPANKPRDHPDRCTSNWQDYGPLQTVTFTDADGQSTSGQRATGAEACVVSTSGASRATLTFPLFGLHTDEGMARCHLIGHNLNGSDSELGNFVPCYQNPTNNAWMYWKFEFQIERQVERDDPVYLTARPIYRGQNPLPIGIMGFAYSNKGWKCETYIPNVTQQQEALLGPFSVGC